jgi:hypothetical protein
MTMHHIASVIVGAGGAATYSFSNIPQTFTHLQLRTFHRSSTLSGPIMNGYMIFNNDGGNNYAIHRLSGNGSSAVSSASTPQAAMYPTWETVPGTSATANSFGVAIVDILDYTGTNKNKVIKSMTGLDLNGSGRVVLVSSLWTNTAAITSIAGSVDGSYAQNSRIDLYGITSNPIARGA